MILHNPFALLAAGMTAIFIVMLSGVLAWVSADTRRSGPFETTFSLVNHRGEPVDQSLFNGSPSLVYFG